MKKKYFGIYKSVIDPYFENMDDISKSIYDNKDIILNNALNPKKVNNLDNIEIYRAEKLVLDNGLEISLNSIHENGVVYNISNEQLCNKSIVPHTEAKLIVGNNMINMFIDCLDYKFDKNKLLFNELEKNIKKEKIFIEALGKEIKLPKLYGKKRSNRILRIFDNNQIKMEKKVLQISMEKSFELLKEHKKEKVLTKSRF